MGVTISNPTFALKTLWPQRRVVNTVYKDHAFLAMIPKSEQFYGENMVIAVRYADTQGRSAAFATAQAAAGAHAGVRFYLTRAADYQVVNLSTEAILATKNDRGALIGMNCVVNDNAEVGEDAVVAALHPVFALGVHIYLMDCAIEDGPTEIKITGTAAPIAIVGGWSSDRALRHRIVEIGPPHRVEAVRLRPQMIRPAPIGHQRVRHLCHLDFRRLVG